MPLNSRALQLSVMEMEEAPVEERQREEAEDEFRFRASYNGTVNDLKWTEYIMDAIFRRRFDKALRALAIVMRGRTADDFDLINALLVTLVNTGSTSEDILQKTHSVLHFNKGQNYHERRLSLYHLLIAMGKHDLARQIIMKDPPESRRGVSTSGEESVTISQDVKAYQEKHIAMLAMNRCLTACWKDAEDENGERSLVFDVHSMPKGSADHGTDSDDHMEPQSETLSTRRLRTRSVTPKRAGSIASASEQKALYELPLKIDRLTLMQLFERCLSDHSLLDTYHRVYAHILEEFDETEKLETLIEAYQGKNPGHLVADHFMLDYFLRYHPDDFDRRRTVLKQMCKNVSYGSHVTQYLNDLETNDPENIEEIIALCEDALNHERHRFDEDVWYAFARCLRLVPEKGNAEIKLQMKDFCSDAELTWKRYHFGRLANQDRASSRLMISKSQVSRFIYGEGTEYAASVQDVLSASSNRKLAKYVEKIDRAREYVFDSSS